MPELCGKEMRVGHQVDYCYNEKPCPVHQKHKFEVVNTFHHPDGMFEQVITVVEDADKDS